MLHAELVHPRPFLASKPTKEELAAAREGAGGTLPLEHKSFGEQLQWYARASY